MGPSIMEGGGKVLFNIWYISTSDMLMVTKHGCLCMYVGGYVKVDGRIYSVLV